MNRVVQNLQASLDEYPRPALIVYHGARHASIVESLHGIRGIEHTEFYNTYVVERLT